MGKRISGDIVGQGCSSQLISLADARKINAVSVCRISVDALNIRAADHYLKRDRKLITSVSLPTSVIERSYRAHWRYGLEEERFMKEALFLAVGILIVVLLALWPPRQPPP